MNGCMNIGTFDISSNHKVGELTIHALSSASAPSSATTTALVLICRRRGLKVCGRNQRGRKMIEMRNMPVHRINSFESETSNSTTACSNTYGE